MNKSVEQIQALQQKTGATFEQADRALTRAKGNRDQALYYIYRDQARKKDTSREGSGLWDRIIGVFLYTVRIDNGEKVYLNIPVWIVYILLLINALASASLYRYNGLITIFWGFLVIYLCVLLSRSSIHIVPPLHREQKLETVETEEWPAEEAYAQYAEDPVETDEKGENSIVIEE